MAQQLTPVESLAGDANVRPLVTFVLGGPGSGKGTQCKRICDEFQFTHLSAGDLLRAERQSPHSQYGELIETHIRDGTIVPVEITCSLLERAMDECQGPKRFLIDGFPRNEDNLSGWMRKVNDKVDVKFVLFLDCPHDICVQRCLSRGQLGSNRSDDNEASLRKRLTTFVNDTMPIVEHYRRLGLLHQVNGARSADQVYADVRHLYGQLMPSSSTISAEAAKNEHTNGDKSRNSGDRKKAIVNVDGKHVCLTIHYPVANGTPIVMNFKRLLNEPLANVLYRMRCNLDKRLTGTRKPQPNEQLMAKYSVSMSTSDGQHLLNESQVLNQDAWIEGNVLNICGQQFVVSCHVPQLLTLALPRCLMAGFPVTAQARTANCLSNECQWRWWRQVFPKRETLGPSLQSSIQSSLPSSAIASATPVPATTTSEYKQQLLNENNIIWEPVGTNCPVFCPTINDVGRKLRVSCTPQSKLSRSDLRGDEQNANDSQQTTNDVTHHQSVIIGDERTAVSLRPIEAGPGECLFDQRHAYTSHRLSGHKGQFRTLTYNLLADLYADSEYSRTQLFPYCPAYALAFDYRRQLLLKEIVGYNADIICLQEVDRKAYVNDLEPTLAIANSTLASIKSLEEIDGVDSTLTNSNSNFAVNSNDVDTNLDGDDHNMQEADLTEPIFSGTFDSKAGLTTEGLATFYRTSRFRLLGLTRCWMSQLIDPNIEMSTSDSPDVNDNTNDNNQAVTNCQQLEDKEKITEQDTAEGADDETTTQSQIGPRSNEIEHLFDEQVFKAPMELFSDIRDAIESNEALSARFKQRKNIVQICVLQSRQTPQHVLVVANNHLYFHPDSDHIRLLQFAVVSRYVEYVKRSVIDRLQSTNNCNSMGHYEVSAMICGDLNSSPDCGPYRLMCDGHVPTTVNDWKSNEQETVVGLELRQETQYASAYCSPVPQYTNYTSQFNACLDWIYYEPKQVQVLATVPLPDHQQVVAHEALPSVVHPSDHLALIADFAFVSSASSLS